MVRQRFAITRFASLCLWACSVLDAWGEDPFRFAIKNIVVADFNGASSVYAADVDGDGDQDVLGAAINADVITWWENSDAEGTLWIEHSIAVAFDGASSVYAADVDGDGDQDVLGAARFGNAIVWWENSDGTGTVWTEHSIAVAFDGAVSVYAADIDGDGDLDVLGAAFNGNAIAWWENSDGAGTVWTQHSIAVAFDGATSVYAADVDGDGDLDVLGAARSGDIAWWENSDGAGTVWVQHAIETDFSDASSVYAADIDGDGDLDVLGGRPNNLGMVWWENSDSEGTVWTKHVIADFYAISVYAADVDGDGELDVLGAARDGGARAIESIAWWKWKPVRAWPQHTVAADFNGARSVYAADIDGDGDQDMLGAARFGDAIAWWENSDGKGTVWTEHSIAVAFDGATSVYAADVDGDGDLDVLGAAGFGNAIVWWENSDGKGTVWPPHTVAADFAGASSVYAADVDGDGDLDVLGAAFNGNAIAWWENSAGAGTVWIPHPIGGFENAQSVYAADVDGDGDLDVLGARSGGDRYIAWWENSTGAGTVWTGHNVTGCCTSAGSPSVSAADIDGDGHLDILGGLGPREDEIGWWRNRANDTVLWTYLETITSDFSGTRSISAADVDGDGDQDVLGAALNDDIIAWWENPSTASEIVLRAAATSLKANGQDATRLTAVVRTPLGLTAVNDDSTQVTFRVIEGPALIGGATAQTVRVKEGVATVVLLSDTSPGLARVEASTGDLGSAPVSIVVRALIAAIGLSTSNLSFGSDIAASPTRRLTIFNTGEGALSVDQILSTNEALFAVSPAAFTVASGDSLTVTVTFTAPASQTTVSGALVIISDDPDEPVLLVPLSAGSLAPALQVAPADSLVFAPATVNDPAGVQEQTLIVSNAGNDTLSVNSIRATDDQFEISPTRFTVAPDQSQPVTITFRPNGSGDISASLVISSDDPNKGFLEIPMRGRGVEPQLEIAPGLADFGAVEVGQSALRVLIISNRGEADLIVTVGPLSAPFTLVESANLAAERPLSLAPGETLAVQVRFTPATREEIAGQLTVSSNDPDQASLGVPLTGRGLAPRLAVSPLTLRFDQVGALDPTPLSLEIVNNGDADLLVTDILASNPAFNPAPVSFTLAPGAQQQVQVTFTPAAIEARSSEMAETLTIFSAVDTFEVALSAKVIDQPIEVYNYPNPIRRGQSTTFWFRQNGAVEIKIFNTAGALVCALRGNGEDHTIVWDCHDQAGGRVSPGLYPYVYLLDGGIKQRRFLQIVE